VILIGISLIKVGMTDFAGGEDLEKGFKGAQQRFPSCALTAGLNK